MKPRGSMHSDQDNLGSLNINVFPPERTSTKKIGLKSHKKNNRSEVRKQFNTIEPEIGEIRNEIQATYQIP